MQEKTTACLTEAVAEAVALVELVAIVEELRFVEAVVLVEVDPLKGETAVEVVGNIVEGLSVVTEVALITFPIVTPHAGATEVAEVDEVDQPIFEVAVAVDVAVARQESTSEICFLT